MFSGSYEPSDVVFLLKPVRVDPTPVHEKERLIQSGLRHYSEMIAPEHLPSAAYLDLFHSALARNRERFARDVVDLAERILGEVTDPVLVSLARAGTPLGVLLKRTIARKGVSAPHYSVSIIRDRGIDYNAMDWIRDRHEDRAVVFIDGWTGKGSIRRELSRTLGEYNATRGSMVPEKLAVIADLAGCAEIACHTEDYLIPNSILNAVVSGLVSRTILNSDLVGEDDFHACVHYSEWAPHDLSRWFVDSITERIDCHLLEPKMRANHIPKPTAAAAADSMKKLIETVMERFNLTDINRVKPGIAEATRAAMRRLPQHVLFRDTNAPDTAHLAHLAREKNIPFSEDPEMPVSAVTIIQSLGR